jgi:uncharacterized lipoprotein YddW (UPF0748 family)
MKKYLLVSLFSFQSILISQPLQEFRAVKLTNVDSNILFTDLNIAQGMDYLASVNVNAVLCVVWNGGYTLYPSNTMDSLFAKPIHPSFIGRDALERVIVEAHRNGIEVYPWFEYGFAAWYSGNNPPSGGHILQAKPDWACRLSNGQIAKKNGFDWMSAIHPEVQDFMNKLINEVMQYDIDGIEFSDRIPAMPIEGGYEPYTVTLYQSENNGQNPPTNFNDTYWKRWRANKMNQWYKNVRTIMKSADPNYFVSTSPSIYPWGYDNYLQDAKTWIDSGICDQFIPQLYRYTFPEYLYELNQSVNQVGTANLHKLFPGILMNIGLPPNDYLISPEYLLAALQANRQRGAMGEAYFYYEGFRKNNNRLGDTLKATFYSQPALMPGRNGNNWRPKATIKNENENGVTITGTWTNYPMQGFTGQIIRTNQTSNYASVEYNLEVPFSAYFDVYAYLTPNTTWTQQGRYVLYGETDSSEVIVNQSNLNRKGWQKIGTVYLSQGNRKVMKIDNRYLESGRYLVADAIMIMINRKLSPNVIVTSVEDRKGKEEQVPTEFVLEQNYPNPFNPSTTISWQSPVGGRQTIKLYDVLGREIDTIVDGYYEAGKHSTLYIVNSTLPSGVYFYRLQVGNYIETKKMILLR